MEVRSPTISVIVPVYNGGAFLHRCLDALDRSTVKPLEVIVVDDCSTDDSAKICRQKGVKVISTAKNSGPAVARNLAARIATGEILLFVDADVVVKADTVAQVGERFRSRPEISALFGSYDDEPGEPNFLSQYKNLQHHYVHQASSPEASTFWSGLGAIRRDVFVEFGGFDEKKFDTPSIEDIELGFRLRRSGHKILLDREIQGKHLKKWGAVSHLRTEILSRAIPWSKLILEGQGLVNDMNLKKKDRLSSGLVAFILIVLPFVFWIPSLLPLIILILVGIALLNWKILSFFARKKGVAFAVLTFPWQLLYFFYGGLTFASCYLWYFIQRIINSRRYKRTNGISPIL